MIVAYHSLLTLPHELTYLPRPRHTRTDGLGNRIPTHYMVQLPGSKRWRRVYVCQWSNAGTAYVLLNKGRDWAVIT